MLALTTTRIARQLAKACRLCGLAVLVTAAGLGCSISPKPQPPALDTGFDFGQVTTPIPNNFGLRLIKGGPGAASPPGGLVRAVNLELTDDLVEAIIADDGSFEVELDLLEGDEARLQIIDGDERRDPVDVVVGPIDTSPQLAAHALGHCLTLAPRAEIDVTVDQTIELTNACGQTVTVIEPSLRRPTEELTIGAGGTWPAQVASGSSLSISVQFQAPAGTLEEIGFIEIGAPESDRRPITVLPAP